MPSSLPERCAPQEITSRSAGGEPARRDAAYQWPLHSADRYRHREPPACRAACAAVSRERTACHRACDFDGTHWQYAGFWPGAERAHGAERGAIAARHRDGESGRSVHCRERGGKRLCPCAGGGSADCSRGVICVARHARRSGGGRRHSAGAGDDVRRHDAGRHRATAHFTRRADYRPWSAGGRRHDRCRNHGGAAGGGRFSSTCGDLGFQNHGVSDAHRHAGDDCRIYSGWFCRLQRRGILLLAVRRGDNLAALFMGGGDPVFATDRHLAAARADQTSSQRTGLAGARLSQHSATGVAPPACDDRRRAVRTGGVGLGHHIYAGGVFPGLRSPGTPGDPFAARQRVTDADAKPGGTPGACATRQHEYRSLFGVCGHRRGALLSADGDPSGQ
ncbi:hypothetical protein BN129_3956 [Cronobacter sakazakii 701]|nr:hypothetical protein BN129_3956 [Cronobacter sakazakii 701]